MTWTSIFNNLITNKDIIRACSVPVTRLDSMFRAITDIRKKVARATIVHIVHRLKKFMGEPNSEYYSNLTNLPDIISDGGIYDRARQGSPLYISLDIPDLELFLAFYRRFQALLHYDQELRDNPQVREFYQHLTDKFNQIQHVNEVPENRTQAEQTTQPEENTTNNYRGFFTPVSDEDVNEDLVTETYSDEEIDKLIGKTFNLQKIENIYRRKKYSTPQLFAHSRCVKCGREKRVILSNLINDPDKYGSCICSDKNLDSRIDNVSQLYSNKKRLSTNTSGYTGVSFVKNYAGEPYNKWRAYIEVDGTRTYLGDFDTKKEAIKARKEAGEKGIKWYKENRSKLVKNVRKRTKKYKTSKYRDTIEKTKVNKK